MPRYTSVIGNLFWCGLLLATALYPCLPAQDPTGEVFALSRFDYALLYLSQPSVIWAQWTGQLSLEFWPVRGQALLPTIVIGGAGTLLGFTILLAMRVARVSLATCSLSFLVGYSLLSAIHHPQTWLFGGISWWGSLFIPCAFVLMIVFVFRQRPIPSSAANNPKRELTNSPYDRLDSKDDSLETSWKRRLMGLFFLATLFVGSMQVIGAMTPSVDNQVRSFRWWNTLHWLECDQADGYQTTLRSLEFDNVAAIWLQATTDSWREQYSYSSASTDESLIPCFYPVFMASKLLNVLSLVSALVYWWSIGSKRYGRGPSVVAIFLMLATPALVELGRYGRSELLSTSVWIAMSSLILRSIPKIENEHNRAAWCVIASILALPLIESCCTILREPLHEREWVMDTLMRFVGFSGLWTTSLIGCASLGLVVKRDRGNLISGLVCLAFFSLVGVLGTRPDRSWVPAIGLLINPVAQGIHWLWQRQSGWIGLPVWSFVLILSCANVAFWPTMDNRILAPVKALVAETWDIPADSENEEVKSTYTKEIRRLVNSGALTMSTKLLLIGVIDDLDLPVKSEAIWDTEPQIESMLDDNRFTHIAIVTPLNSNLRTLTVEQEIAIRNSVNASIDREKLIKIAVSDNCPELSLYEVSGSLKN